MPRQRSSAFTVHQFHASVEPRHAVTNEMLAIAGLLRRQGATCRLYSLHSGSLDGEKVRSIQERDVSACDHLIIHYSLDDEGVSRLLAPPCRTSIVYHGITPAEFFDHVNPVIAAQARRGCRFINELSRVVPSGVAHSEFAAAELRAAGFRDVQVLPYLQNKRVHATSTTEATRTDSDCELLVVGRVSPQKRIEEALFVLHALNRIAPDAWRLRVIGSASSMEPYLYALRELQRCLALNNVNFMGSVDEVTLVDAFCRADAYLCLSAHEGFCVPLLEAMQFRVPVFAVAAGAVAETMGNAGVLFTERDWTLIAQTIHLSATDPHARTAILDGQSRRASQLSIERAERLWDDWLRRTR
jgi:glycosyltransferase involved in cell wall biosynthesis